MNKHILMHKSHSSHKSYCVSFVVAALFSFLPLYASEQNLTYIDLIHRLTDLEHLATLPEPGEKAALFSSYDRKSRYDSATGKYINWDANGDGDGFIRREGNKLVLAEMKGPGCIWRIWSATPQNGHVRIYLDDASEPAVDLPFISYFDGNHPPFNRSALVHTVARGWNNYTPIPYQKSCKIVADPGWGLYYHFNYSTFPPGTHVPTFKLELTQEENAALDQANRLLTDCGPYNPHGDSVVSSDSGPQIDESTIGSEMKGPAAITSIRIKTDLPAPPADFDALRSITIEMSWDDDSIPSVWAPLGDFFGTAPGSNEYRSLPLGLTEDGWWYCNWFMPFAKNAKILIKKPAGVNAGIHCQISSKPLTTDISKYVRFHAKWHRDIFLPSEPERVIDWPVVKTEGAGRFVGMMLHIWNPRGGWWGEGDEKFFVDGEKFPSTIGTGSEDYFGYAWSDGARFTHAYHNQTHNDGNSKGHISVNRWHISDNVPFQKCFEGDIEKYFSNQRPTLYAAMAYWYLAPDGKDPYAPVPVSQRIGYWAPIQTFRVKGALEGESLKIIAKTGGNPQVQDMSGFTGDWSGDAHLWWTQGKPGDKLDLALPVEKNGKYKISLQMTKARDYAIVQLYLDGTKLGAPLDLYNPSVIPTGLLVFGTHNLKAGEHRLTLEIVGANEKADKAYMAGLDCVKLETVR